MRIVFHRAPIDPDRMPFDVAERKGIGHPDSLADLVADTFTQRYAQWFIECAGIVPNHWVDKINLVGASANVWFGGFEIIKPVDCYLFGKITVQVGPHVAPIERIFADSLAAVLPVALADKRIMEHLRLHVDNSSGVATDHHAEFYRPSSATAVSAVLASETVANDTVICVGGSRPGRAGELAARLETWLTGDDFLGSFPAAGTDVKVMVVRTGSDFDATVCLPIHPDAVDSWEAYDAELRSMRPAIEDAVGSTVRLHLNTKDLPGRGYLAPFGTSLGKGDCGAVGRGNRLSGVIEPLRPASCEAPAGKNPLHHVGKIYSAATADIAARILRETGAYAEVTLAARNGHRLDDPAYALVTLDANASARAERRAERIIEDVLADVEGFATRFQQVDLLHRFRRGGPE
jgi:S-adenosylmethionine synthetase